MEKLQLQLSKRRSQGNLRKLVTNSDLIDFASNDYLGFARAPDLQDQIVHEWSARKLYSGSTGSRLLTGNSSLHQDLEEWIAGFHDAKAGLIYNSGYAANSGLLSAVASAGDTILYDIHVHASIHEGMKLSGAKCLPFRHQDLNHLEKRLKNCQGQAFVCIESLYSMDGTVAPLLDICNLCERYQASLILDEAHSTGIMGDNGLGLAQELGCQHRIFARIHTFGKALGVHGAIVLGSQQLKEFLINFSKPWIYTTALPPLSLIAIHCAYQKLIHSPHLIRRLNDLAAHFKHTLQVIGYPNPTGTPIQPITHRRVDQLTQILQNEGFDVRAIKSPTVKRGSECLRICIHAFNTYEQIDQLAGCLDESLFH
jgi:8-amino-7-oxononanoate synthase